MPVKKIVGVAVFFLSLFLGHIAHFSAINSLNVPLIILLQGIALALLSRHILTVACCTLLFCLFAVYCPQQARITDTLLLYVVPLGALLGTFACSLLPAHTPLISRVAQQVHGPLRADVARYTRFLTLFWALFFAGALLAPAVLALAGPDGSWRWPLSGGTFACAAGVMLVEAYVRRRVIRNFEHVSLRETVSAFRKASSRPTSGRV